MNFKRYVEASDTWVDSHYIMSPSTDTITTLPAVIHPTGTTATVGLKGNTVQNGTPTPDNPVMPQGTGERTGNLLDFYALQNAPSGTIGTSACNHVLELVLEANTAYTCIANGSGSTSGSADDNRSIYFNNSDATNVVYSGHSVTVTTGADGKVKIGFFSSRANAQQYINGTSQVWLVKGSAPLSYEPYGYKIPISSNSQTETVYLGNTQSVRIIKKKVLDGTENWTQQGSSSYRYFRIDDDISAIVGYAISNCYEQAQISVSNTNVGINVQNVSAYTYPALVLRPENFAGMSLSDFKSYLSSNPVTVWYVLATPQTAVVNEPLMKIGEYADTVSNVSIPVIVGGDTISVGTTVQPSKVTVNYKGWHPVSAVHERENGAWT